MLKRTKAKVKSFLQRLGTPEQDLHSEQTFEQDLHSEQFEAELALIENKHENNNCHPSIIHFSFNKAATQYIKSILTRCAVENSIVPVRLNQYAFNSGFPYLDSLSIEEIDAYRHIFKNKGYLYTVFGGMVKGVNFDDYKIVLVTRDPRDILVSRYYSAAHSHVPPSEEGNKYDYFMSKRKAAQESSIDEFVIAESENVCNKFFEYQTLLLDRYSDVYITKYEEMIFNFEGWLADLLKYCELNLSDEFIQALIDRNESMRPKEEDIKSHIRKGIAGDYKEKLQPATVEMLNEKFAPILAHYSYDDF
jgi:hypothetical protein